MNPPLPSSLLDLTPPPVLAPAASLDTLDAALDAFGSRPASFLSSHPGDCCRSARRWFEALAIAAAQTDPATPPAWIRERWDWGPNDWPLPWCQIPRSKTLDCGALACLARAAFAALGHRVRHVQLLERFDREAVAHWRAAWRGRPSVPLWTEGVVAYHEAVAVERPGRTWAIWDPTDNRFVEPTSRPGYASILAVRLVERETPPETAGDEAAHGEEPRSTGPVRRWHGLALDPGRWRCVHGDLDV